MVDVVVVEVVVVVVVVVVVAVEYTDIDTGVTVKIFSLSDGATVTVGGCIALTKPSSVGLL